jgi:cell division protein FtsN
MSRDYKPATAKSSGNKGSPFLTGLLVGVLLGVGLSLWVTMYLKGGDSPFAEPKVNKPAIEAHQEKDKEKPAVDSASEEDVLPKEESPESAKADNDFDFYTILPETESTVTEQEVQESSIKKDNYFLQVGAFQDEADADNMKAKLALQGFEAVVQTATIPEKGVWHRVRVGPLNDIVQINKVRGELTTNGFNTDLIKVHTETKPE